jgi:hypothetical protein
MQLIEVSEIGVRASIVSLTSRACKLRWLMFPMVHLGPPKYYAEVERRMHRCDLVLAEGIDSKIVAAITMAYRAADRSSRLGTVMQPTPQSGPPGPQIAASDLNSTAFDEAWHRMPLPIRFGLPLVAPLFGLWLRFVANPQDIHQRLETYDLPSREEIAAEAKWPELFDLLLRRRDAHLLEQVVEIHERSCAENRTVGIAYGALHIPAVVHYLTGKLGYIASSAEWITVFDYTK